MPDGTLLSMPIPADEGISYSEISWNGITYADILKQINPKKKYDKCHVDPDIRNNRIEPVAGWKPAFGQANSPLGQLRNAGVETGDIFLFFGWFRGVERVEGNYRFRKRDPKDFYAGNDLQVIFGYLQVGEIITNQEQIKQYFWHPHSSMKHTKMVNNALFLPTEKLSINPSMKGYRTFYFRKDRVLTMEGKSRATWNEYDFLKPEHIYGKKKNLAKKDGIYYSGIWQEMIIYESEGLIDWVNKVVC